MQITMPKTKRSLLASRLPAIARIGRTDADYQEAMLKIDGLRIAVAIIDGSLQDVRDTAGEVVEWEELEAESLEDIGRIIREGER